MADDRGFQHRQRAVVLRADVGAGPAICRRLERDGFDVRRIAQTDFGRGTVSDVVTDAFTAGATLLVNNLCEFERVPVVAGVRGFAAALDEGLNSTFSACREAARVSIESGSSLHILNVVSATAGVGLPGRAMEACVSAGLVAASKALAAEWGAAGVRVNVVMVGPTESWQPAGGSLDGVPGVLPLGRLVDDDDVAAAVASLSAPDLGAVTGHVFAVDAGWLAHGWRRE
ncbi:MAG TPA: SDR family oxidoreductase [Acidimicrobiia bacterium]|nr:SDR family oxidoreductase [Acidimicrobiia bacterium]